MKMKLPLRYEPCGDSDGELHGIDHFVMDAAGNEISCAPDEESARRLVATCNFCAGFSTAQLEDPAHSLRSILDTHAEEMAEAVRANQELLATLKSIAALGGNLPDAALTGATGPNDARQRGEMYCTARRLALEAVAALEGKSNG